MGLVRGFIAFESVECIPDDGLDVSDLSVSISLAFPSLVGKRPVILANEEKQVVSNAIRHFDSVHDLAARFVMAAQIVDFRAADRTLPFS
jgi:hypothetical protein